MAVGTFTPYSNAIFNISKALINLSSDTFVMILATTSYTPAPDTNATFTNLSANEVANGLGYTTGGVVLTGVSNTLSSATVTWTTASATWATATFTCRYGIICKRAAGSLVAGDLLVGFVDLTGSGSVTGQGGSFVVAPNAGGWFSLTHSP